MCPKSTPLPDAALAYAGRGWPVLPVYSLRDGLCTCGQPDCSSSGKHPRTLHGVKDATTDEATIREWWSKWPDANIGVATGEASGLLVLDIDPRNGGADSLADLEQREGPLPATVETLTGGGGRHLLFAHAPGASISCRANLWPGIDIRANGGYIVAPPSHHLNGTSYRWNEGRSPDQIALADAPDWVLEALRNGTEKAPAHEAADPVPLDDLKVPDQIKVLISDGHEPRYLSRSEGLFAAIRSLIKAGHDDPSIRAVLLDPGNALSEKPREKGLAWLDGEIDRARSKPDNSTESTGGTKSTSTHRRQCLADVEPEDVEWLWPPFIPIGKVTSIEGDPGVGKSWFTIALAAALSRGAQLPGGHSLKEPQRVLFFTAEDGLADTVRPRLDALGADARYVFAVEGPLTIDENGAAILERHIKETKPALVIIDPLVAYMGGHLDINKANHVRSMMARLAGIAERHQVAIVVVRHLTKGRRDRAIYRGLGSIDITAACRSVLLVGTHPEDETRRVVAHAKSNLAPLGKSLSYRITDGRFEWGGEVDLSAEQLCQGPEDMDSLTAREEAKEFLQELLADGPVAAPEVIDQAKELGIDKSTLDRAKKALGIRSRRQGLGWAWELPRPRGENVDDVDDLDDLGT